MSSRRQVYPNEGSRRRRLCLWMTSQQMKRAFVAEHGEVNDDREDKLKLSLKKESKKKFKKEAATENTTTSRFQLFRPSSSSSSASLSPTPLSTFYEWLEYVEELLLSSDEYWMEQTRCGETCGIEFQWVTLQSPAAGTDDAIAQTRKSSLEALRHFRKVFRPERLDFYRELQMETAQEMARRQMVEEGVCFFTGAAQTSEGGNVNETKNRIFSQHSDHPSLVVFTPENLNFCGGGEDNSLSKKRKRGEGERGGAPKEQEEAGEFGEGGRGKPGALVMWSVDSLHHFGELPVVASYQ